MQLETYVNQFPRCDLRRTNLGVAAVADVSVAAGSMGLLQCFSLPPDIMCCFSRIACLCLFSAFCFFFVSCFGYWVFAVFVVGGPYIFTQITSHCQCNAVARALAKKSIVRNYHNHTQIHTFFSRGCGCDVINNTFKP